MYSRVTSALASINQLDKYEPKFKENEMDDAMVDLCLNDSALLVQLNEIIDVTGHRIRFILEFKKLGQQEEVEEASFELVNDEVTVSIPKISINQLSSTLQTTVRIQDGFQMENRNLEDHLLVAHQKAIETYEQLMNNSITDLNCTDNSVLFLDPETLETFSKFASKKAVDKLFGQFGELEDPSINMRREQIKFDTELGKRKASFELTNNQRRTKAENQMETAFSEATRNYKSAMVTGLHLEDNFKINVVSNEELQSLHDSTLAQILQNIAETFYSNPLCKTTQEKITAEIQKELSHFESSVHFSNKNAEDAQNERLEDALSNYEKKMSEFSGLDGEALWKCHENVKSLQLKSLDCQLAKYPSPAQLHGKLSLELLNRIDKSYAQIRNKLETRQKKFQESLNSEEKATTMFYSKEIETFLGAGNKFFEESALSQRHASIEELAFTNFKMAFEKFSGASSVSEFAREHFDVALERISGAIEIKYRQVQEQNKARETLFISRSRNVLNDAKLLYSTKIKKIMEEAKDEKEFKKKEEVARKDALNHLHHQIDSSTSPSNQLDFFSNLELDLSDHTDSFFAEHLELFQLRQEEDELMVKRALYEAKTYYNEEMEKRFIAKDFLGQKELLNLNDHLTSAAMAKCQEEVELSPGQEQKLREAMRVVYLKFAERNLMRVPMENPAIGIDLGTTYSCVGVYINGRVVIIPNENGNRITPSYVAFPNGRSSGSSIIVGDVAKSQSFKNPMNTIFDAKRLIGRKFTDPVVQKDMNTWPFEVVDVDGRPKVKAGNRTYYPEEISAQVLKKMKKIAEDYLGKEVRDCVITVPALFNDGQRQATRDAGQIAGLNVLRIINEPTAAAIAFQLHRSDDLRRNVLIFDLGGGTFDVAILEMSEGEINVKAVHGDTHLGGEDFDSEMTKYCMESFKTKNKLDLGRGSNEKYSKEAIGASGRIRRIRNACQEQKRVLSVGTEACIALDSIDSGLDLDVHMTRTVFESLNQIHFDECLRIVQLALEEAHLTKSEIDDIVLVGGSTRIPKIQEMLSDFFDGRALSKQINPDEAVAYGAAIQACLLAKKKGGLGADSLSLSLRDVCPLSIGVRVYDKSLSVIIPKNTPLPNSYTKTYYKVYETQTECHISIYEGENLAVANQNNLLGEFTLKGIPPGPCSSYPLDITMTISDEGILNVKAVVRCNGSTKEISIIAQKKRLTLQEIQKAQADA